MELYLVYKTNPRYFLFIVPEIKYNVKYENKTRQFSVKQLDEILRISETQTKLS